MYCGTAAGSVGKTGGQPGAGGDLLWGMPENGKRGDGSLGPQWAEQTVAGLVDKAEGNTHPLKGHCSIDPWEVGSRPS